MEAGKRTINDIFNGNKVLEIPFFQRSYVWGETQWQRFLEDMELVSTENKPYFLGSVILKQKLTSSDNQVGDMRTLIDGQQRLTTLNIFFKVLSLETKKTPSFNRIFKLENDELALCHNHNDIHAFQKVLNLTEFEDIVDKDNISQAYNFFKQYTNFEKLDWHKILINVVFIGIDLGIEEDEQQIFDTINSLGVRLTTAELLKNYFFDKDIEQYKEFWKSVFEQDDETKEYWDLEITTGRTKRTFIDLFFYSYLQIKIQEKDLNVNSKDKIEFSKVEKLFESYKSLIGNYQLEKIDVLKEIREYAILFKANFNYDIINQEISSEYGIERINAIIFGLETSTLIPYVLYAIKNIDSETDINKLFEFVESYIMRRIVVKATSKNYNQLFTDSFISNKLLSKEKIQDYLSDNPNYIPNDEQVKNGFDNSVIVNKQAAGIIYMIESKVRDSPKEATRLLGINKYSLEHLMPKKWRNHWGEIDSEKEEHRDFKLKTLGNLAIITQSLNASIRDSNWETKQKGKNNKDGLKRYSAGIETLYRFFNGEWNESKIEERAQFLYEQAIKIWKK